MAGQIKQSINVLDSEVLRAVGNLHDLVARADLPFFKHTAIKAWPLVGDQECSHLRVVHPYTDAIAGDARLRHFKQRAADPEAISDADFVVGKAIDCKVLAELTILEVVTLELHLPVTIGAELIDHHSTVFSAVARDVALTIPVEIETASHHPARYGPLPDSGVDYFALPIDIDWKADVHGNKQTHGAPSLQ
jgi:hypothetical protein